MGLNRDNGIPLYVQVRERLLDQVSGMEPGEAIPTESELEARFVVSRITIRRAVESLVAQGLLMRCQGRGTFVQRPKLTHQLSEIASWTDQLTALGYVPRTSQRRIEQIPAPGRIARMLKLAKGEEVTKIHRVRLANDEPISLMYNYLPSRLVPKLDQASFTTESLYELLRIRYDLVAASSEDVVEARHATEDEAETLKIEPWSAVLCVTRVSCLSDGSPLDVAIVVSRGDRFQYRVLLHRRVHRATTSGHFNDRA